MRDDLLQRRCPDHLPGEARAAIDARDRRAFGGYGERVTKPEDIVAAIKRGIQKTKEGVPVLLEFITSKEVDVARPGT